VDSSGGLEKPVTPTTGTGNTGNTGTGNTGSGNTGNVGTGTGSTGSGGSTTGVPPQPQPMNAAEASSHDSEACQMGHAPASSGVLSLLTLLGALFGLKRRRAQR
jgi:hypothetical protein